MNNLTELLPTNWSNITVEQYIELSTIDTELSATEQLLERIAILCDIGSDDELFDDLSFEDLFGMVNNITWINELPSTNYLKNNISEYYLKEINTLTLGEFIDLEYYFAENYILNLPIICAILYRQNKIDEMWGHTLIEPYRYDIKIRSNFFLNKSILDVFGIINYYLKFKEMIMSNYKEIFNKEDDDKDEIEGEEIIEKEASELNKREQAEEAAQLKKDEAIKKLSWEKLIYDLSANDITKFNAITDLPLIYVLNTLSMLKITV